MRLEVIWIRIWLPSLALRGVFVIPLPFPSFSYAIDPFNPSPTPIIYRAVYNVEFLSACIFRTDGFRLHDIPHGVSRITSSLVIASLLDLFNNPASGWIWML